MSNSDIFQQALLLEAQGDQSNLKGTDYHLLYAISRLLVDGGEVTFFAGNDLLLTDSKPASPFDPGSFSVGVKLCNPESQSDTWVQLKCTEKAWTPNLLLDDNLLRNFVFNTYLSDAKGHSYEIRLITTAPVRSDRIRELVSGPVGSNKNSDAKLDGIVAEIQAALSASVSDTITNDAIRDRCKEILLMIADSQPVSRELLSAKLMEQLAYRIPDKTICSNTANAIYGAMLKDSIRDDVSPVTYDLVWLSKVAGHDFVRSRTIDDSVTEMCSDHAVRRKPFQYGQHPTIRRAGLNESLNQFVDSPKSLFVLDGASGVGKSLALYEWVIQQPKKIRLFVPGSDLELTATLDLILRREFPNVTGAGRSDYLLTRFSRAANSNFGPLVIVLDDLRPSIEQPIEFAKMLARITREAQELSIKIIASCQSDFLANQRPFSRVDRESIYLPSDDRDKEPLDDATTSYSLTEFDDQEIEFLVEQKFDDPSTVHNVTCQLLDPTLNLLRNPYLLSTFLSQSDEQSSRVLDSSSLVQQLLDSKLERYIKEATKDCGRSTAEIRETIELILECLWDSYGTTLTRAKLQVYIRNELDQIGLDCVDSFYRTGLLTDEKPEKFSDRGIWSRFMATRLVEKGLSATDVTARLSWEQDHDLVAQIVAVSPDPIATAIDFSSIDVEWTVAVSAGLAYCDPSDVRVFSLLMSFARKSPNLAVANSIGRFAFRSKEGISWLRRRFMSRGSDDREIAEYALWNMHPIAPRIVGGLIRLRLRISQMKSSESDPFDHKLSERRKCAASALFPLENTDRTATANRGITILRAVRPFVERVFTGNLDRDMVNVHTDPLVGKYDQVHAFLLSIANPSELQTHFATLMKGNKLSRTRAVTSLPLVSRTFSHLVKDEILRCVAEESDTASLSRSIWDAYNLLENDADSVLDAVVANQNRIWLEYESTAACLTLLEEAAAFAPDRVQEILPKDWLPGKREHQALASPIRCVAEMRCRAAANHGRAGAIADTSLLVEAWEEELEFLRHRTRLTVRLVELSQTCNGHSFPMIHRMDLREYGSDFFLHDLGSWVKTLNLDSLPVEDVEEIVRIVIAQIEAGRSYKPDLRDRLRRNVKFFVERDSLLVMTTLLGATPELSMLVTDLHNDWQGLYVTTELLKSGVHEPELIDFALKQCDLKHKSSMPQGSAERRECLIQLARIVPDRVQGLEHEKRGIGDFLTGGTDRAKQGAAIFDLSESQLIESIEAEFAAKDNAFAFRDWDLDAKEWKPAALADVYCRGLRMERLGKVETSFLLNSIVAALEELPESAAQQEHLRLYSAIQKRSGGQVTDSVVIRESENALIRSHQLAAKIVATPDEELTESKISEYVRDPNGWMESHGLRSNGIAKMSRGSGTGHYVVGFYPAVRLALRSISEIRGVSDPCLLWMKERQAAELAVKEFTIPRIPTGDKLTRAIASLRDLNSSLQNQDAVLATLGHLLVVDEKAEEAVSILKAALGLGSCEARRRGGVHYNLGCAHALIGNPDLCREHLIAAKEFGGLDKEWIQKDSDLDSVRQLDWFAEL